jgi:carboxylesterase 2
VLLFFVRGHSLPQLGQITIFGESAGAWSVQQLLGTPPQPVPFVGAILESNGASTGPGTPDWGKLTDNLTCTNTNNPQAEYNCVVKAGAAKIENIITSNSFHFPPVIDSSTCPTTITTNIVAGNSARVPVLIGSNSGESQIAFSALGAVTQDTLLTFIEYLYPGSNANGPIATQIAKLFGNLPDTALARAFTDYEFTCPTRAFSQYLHQQGYQVWRYFFSATFENTDLGYANPGAYHGSEIPLVWGTYPTKNATGDEPLLSNTMQQAWADFARNAKADNGVGPASASLIWPQFVGGTQNLPYSNFNTEDLESFANGPITTPVAEKIADANCALYWSNAKNSF